MKNAVSPSDPFVAQVVARHGEDLLLFLTRRLKSAADARDIAQEAYVRLLRVQRKDLIENPQAYLFRIAANLLHEVELKRRSDLEGMQRWAKEREQHTDPIAVERAADSLVMQRRFDHVLDGLTSKCRAVLVLHRRDGMTYDEIGARIGISSSMVKKYLSIGLRICRERLRDLE